MMERIRRDRLRPPNTKGILNFIKRRINPKKTIPDRHLSIFLTTVCNLECYSCAAIGMKPRPKPEFTSLEEIHSFLEAAQHLHPESYIMLTGGEPTAYPQLKEACDLVRGYGFKTAMLTNGYRLVDPSLFDFIMLDLHGDSNSEQIEKWRSALDDLEIDYGIHHKEYHQDIRLAMKGNITKGARCSNWLEPITLWKNVIYPCCNLMCCEWWANDFTVTEALIKAEWTTDNEGLLNTIKNWRETLPAEVYKLCTLGCWKDSDKASWVMM